MSRIAVFDTVAVHGRMGAEGAPSAAPCRKPGIATGFAVDRFSDVLKQHCIASRTVSDSMENQDTREVSEVCPSALPTT
jgi:hypothetical protein